MDGDQPLGLHQPARPSGLNEIALLDPAPDGRWIDLPVPADRRPQGRRSAARLIVTLVEPARRAAGGRARRLRRSPTSPPGQAGRAGAGDGADASQAIEEVSATDHVLWVKALDDVSGQAVRADAATRTAAGPADRAAARQQHHPSRRHRRQAGPRLRDRRGHAARRRPSMRSRAGAGRALVQACRRSSMPALQPSSSASRPRRTARACPISWSARRARPARCRR